MPTTTPLPEVPNGLVEQLLDGPALQADRIEAGRQRAADGPAEPTDIADAIVNEGPPLLHP